MLYKEHEGFSEGELKENKEVLDLYSIWRSILFIKDKNSDEKGREVNIVKGTIKIGEEIQILV